MKLENINVTIAIQLSIGLSNLYAKAEMCTHDYYENYLRLYSSFENRNDCKRKKIGKRMCNSQSMHALH